MTPLLAEHMDHLKNGGKLIVEAIPVNPKYKPITLAFDLKHFYEVKMLPVQSWIRDQPIMDIPEGVTADDIVRQVMSTFTMMCGVTGGIQLVFSSIEKSNAPSN